MPKSPTNKKKETFQILLRMRSPKKVDMIFDLVCFANYVAGQMDTELPVEESREVFAHIKKLLALPTHE